jgi:DNA-binding NarL/FixJ family response regulator
LQHADFANRADRKTGFIRMIRVIRMLRNMLRYLCAFASLREIFALSMAKSTLKKDPINVMVVEDDELFRTTMQEIINDSELLRCEHAYESCEDALDAVREECVPEVLLLDIDLPGMSGIEGIKHFKEISPASRVIMLTVFDDDDKIFNAICCGASGYLLKSSTSENVVKCIIDVVAGGAAMSPTIAARVLAMFTQFSAPQKEYGLTGREKEILQLLVNGMSKKHIASHLNLSLFTVDTHLKNIYSKLQVHSQIDVVAKALREKLV